MGMFNRKHMCAAGALALLLTSPAYAAVGPTQGTLGSTSTGQINISASVASKVQISNLSDVTFSSVDPGSAALNAQNVCVFSNTGTKGYNIKASGSGAASAFTLASNALTVPYTVEWANTTAQNSGTSLIAATALTGQTSNAANPTCNGGANPSASLIVKISSSDLLTMQSATSYTGTLTLLVGPE